MRNTAFIIMAAHEKEGMVSSLPKIMHKLCGLTMLEHIFDIIQPVTENKPILVLDPSQQAASLFASDKAFIAEQNSRTGTGHAVQLAAQYIPEKSEYVVIMPPDMPLIRTETLKKLIEHTAECRLSACVLTSKSVATRGQGRVFLDKGTLRGRIVEENELAEHEKDNDIINTGIICFDKQHLLEVLWGLSLHQDQLYITDCVEALGRLGSVDVLELSAAESLRIKNRVDLAEASKTIRKEILINHMLSGVTIIDPDNTYIDKTVRIGQDTIIYPNNYIEGDTVIGRNCCLYPGNRLTDCEVYDNVNMQGAVAASAVIHDSVRLGPYTHLRPGTVMHPRSFAGAFVQMKNAEFGEGSKAGHLAYVGDAKIGRNVNIGCGVVFVNYDGKHKHTSIVGDHAFVGSNANLISPVTIGDNGFVAAGSTVTENVPSDALCIARSRQENKEGWVIRRNKQDADKNI